jgi:hypothetical protein
MTDTFKPGSKVNVQDYGSGTVVRISGLNDSVYVVLLDDASKHAYNLDVKAARKLGLLNTGVQAFHYAFKSQLTPIQQDKWMRPSGQLKVGESIRVNTGGGIKPATVVYVLGYRTWYHLDGVDYLMSLASLIPHDGNAISMIEQARQLGFDPDAGAFSCSFIQDVEVLESNDRIVRPQAPPIDPMKIDKNTVPGTIVIYNGKPYIFACPNHASPESEGIITGIGDEEGGLTGRMSNPDNIAALDALGIHHKQVRGDFVVVEYNGAIVDYSKLSAPSLGDLYLLKEARKARHRQTPGYRMRWTGADIDYPGENVSFMAMADDPPGSCWVRFLDHDNVMRQSGSLSLIEEPKAAAKAEKHGYDPELPIYGKVLYSELSAAHKPTSHLKPGDIFVIEVDGIKEEAVALCLHRDMDRWCIRLQKDTAFTEARLTGPLHKLSVPIVVHAPHVEQTERLGFDPNEERYATITPDAIVHHWTAGDKVNVGGKIATYIAPARRDAIVVGRQQVYHPIDGIVARFDNVEDRCNHTRLGIPFHREQAGALDFNEETNEYVVLSSDKFQWISSDTTHKIVEGKTVLARPEYDAGYLELEKGDIVKVKLTDVPEEVEVIVITDASTHDSVVVILKDPPQSFTDRYSDDVLSPSFDDDFADEIKIAKGMGLTLDDTNVWICSGEDTKVIEKIGKHAEKSSIGPGLMLLGALGGALLSQLSNTKQAAPIRVANDIVEPEIFEAVVDTAKEMSR